MSAAANNATPTNSLTRREAVDRLKSNLHDDGQYERAAARSLPEEAPELDPQLLFDQALVRSLLDAGALHDVGQHADPVGQKLLAVLHHEPSRDDLRNAFERTGLLVDRHHRDDESIFRQVATVAQDLVADFTRVRVVDQDPPDRRFA